MNTITMTTEAVEVTIWIYGKETATIDCGDGSKTLFYPIVIPAYNELLADVIQLDSESRSNGQNVG